MGVCVCVCEAERAIERERERERGSVWVIDDAHSLTSAPGHYSLSLSVVGSHSTLS